MSPLSRSALGLFCAAGLLLLGVQALVHGLATLGAALGTLPSASDAVPALEIYTRTVLVKGLLPQLVLAFGLWSLGARSAGRFGERISSWRSVAEIGFASLLAFSVVAPLLLAVDSLGLPALVMKTAGNVAWSALLMSAATTGCLALPLALLPPARRKGSGAAGDRPGVEASG